MASVTFMMLISIWLAVSSQLDLDKCTHACGQTSKFVLDFMLESSFTRVEFVEFPETLNLK